MNPSEPIVEDAPPGDATAAPEARPPSVSVAETPAGTKRGFVEWFWRGAALREAGANEGRLPPPALALSFELTEVADRLLSRIDPPRSGSGTASAIVLYAEAERVILEAMGEATESASSPPPPPLAALSEEERRTRGAAARAVVHAALGRVASGSAARARLLRQRWVRTSFVVVLVASALVGCMLLATRARSHPNLLSGAAMRTSSSYAGFSLEEHLCDGKKTDILFHTDREDSASVTFDLRAPLTVSHVELVNRSDCCGERAIPLVVEVSADGVTYREVLRRSEPFDKLVKPIPAVQIRSLRVRTLRKTWLHLEKVAAW